MDLYVHYTALPEGMELADVVAGLNEIMDEGGYVCGGLDGRIDMELEDEKMNPKIAQGAVKTYVQQAGFPKDTVIEQSVAPNDEVDVNTKIVLKVSKGKSQPVEVEKTMNTADFVPTMENLLGFNSPYHYLGQDAFNDSYEGYAFFPDGSWISNGVTCTIKTGGEPVILENKADRHLSEEYIGQMTADAQRFIQISNLLLTTDYYSND